MLQANGWTVLQVWDEYDRSVEPGRWATDRFDAGMSFLGEESMRLVVAKSLTSLAIPVVVERALPGVWFTPLLDEEEVRSALANSAGTGLVIGGTDDPTWDSEFVSQLTGVEVLEIDGADHLLQQQGDPARSIENLKIVIDRVEEFVDRLI